MIRRSPRCPDCGRLTQTPRHTYCATCAQRHRRAGAGPPRRPNTTARGYGAAHQKLRARWAPRVAAGGVACGAPASFCLRPTRWIAPGEPWDLGHPFDRKDYEPVPWHRVCNRSFAVKVTLRRRKRVQ